jgi:hypothetical protein
MIVNKFFHSASAHPFVLDEALVNFAAAGHHVLAELLAVGFARKVERPVQVEVVGL